MLLYARGRGLCLKSVLLSVLVYGTEFGLDFGTVNLFLACFFEHLTNLVGYFDLLILTIDKIQILLASPLPEHREIPFTFLTLHQLAYLCGLLSEFTLGVAVGRFRFHHTLHNSLVTGLALFYHPFKSRLRIPCDLRRILLVLLFPVLALFFASCEIQLVVRVIILSRFRAL